MKLKGVLPHVVGVAVVAATVAGCGQKQSGISGVIEGAGGKTLYLSRYVNQRVEATDSVQLAQDGSFSLTPSPGLDLNFYKLSVSDQDYLILLADSTENINIQAKAGEMGESSKIEGSKNSALLQEYNTTVNGMKRKVVELNNKMRQAGLSQVEVSQYRQEVVELKKGVTDFSKEFIKINAGSPAVFAALSELSFKTDMATFEEVLDKTKESFGHSFQYKMVSQQLASAKKTNELQKSGTPPQQQANSKYVTGNAAPNIKMNDPAGTERQLTDMKGKVVLLDFWASWCGPCRRENPNVVAAYKKYNKDGFEVFSVSLDRDLGRWKQAIEQDGLLWPNHVSDLKGWQSEAAALYGIHSIPHTILLDREGKVMETHLRGPALEQKLHEIFGY
ncbi:MAG: AhpC/TSA family protein [Flavobacteriales bacterium]|nr:AhpC/TSA family protein [Flavobacteriales bacterium]